MNAPIIRVDDVAFPRFRAPDLTVMEEFLHTFGMHTLARTDDALHMRGTDGTHAVHVTHLGEPAFLGLAFRATSLDDLATLSAATGAPVEDAAEPGGGKIVHLHDPDGRIVDVVAGIAPEAPLPIEVHDPINTGAERVRIGLQRVPLGASQVKRFGHAAIKTTSLAALATWYADTLGLLISDDVYLGDPGLTIGRFMRCDRGDLPADHHSLLILETGEVRLGHCAWEVADWDDLMTGHQHLTEAGHRHYWGVGRHILGGQVFDYWKDPLGFTVEHWTDTDLLTADVASQAHDVAIGINQWGPNPPDDLDF